MLNKTNNKKYVFTLVEVLVVILIIGLLFVVLIPRLSTMDTKAKETGVKSDFHSFQTAMESATKEHGGIGGNSGVTGGSIVGVINDYLDPALKIRSGTADSAGTLLSEKTDPWNKK